MNKSEDGAEDSGDHPVKPDERRERLQKVIADFGLHEGGPFERLNDRLGLLSKAAQSAPRRALITAFLCWGMLLLLTAMQGDALGDPAAGPFLRDLSAFARYAIAAPLLVLMDRKVDLQLRRYLGHFVDAPLLAPRAMPAAAEAVVQAIDRARATAPILICAVLAICIANLGVLVSDVGGTGWRTATLETGARLTAAGWWVRAVSAPLFWFLLLRALWRYFVWALLLRRVARLEMRLVATHPDGAGGLGFLGQHPNVFSALVFALAVSVAGAVAQALKADLLSLEAYGWLLSAWVGLTVALFAAPLWAFRQPLDDLRRRTRFAAAAQLTRNYRAQEREIFGRNLAAIPGAPEEEPASGADALKADEAARKLSVIPFSRAAIVPLAAASLLPLLAAGVTRLPYAELLRTAKRILLF